MPSRWTFTPTLAAPPPVETYVVEAGEIIIDGRLRKGRKPRLTKHLKTIRDQLASEFRDDFVSLEWRSDALNAPGWVAVFYFEPHRDEDGRFSWPPDDFWPRVRSLLGWETSIKTYRFIRRDVLPSRR